MALTKQDVIIFSSIDWTIHWQLHHQLTTSLVSAGNRVLYIDNTGIRSAKISDTKRLKERVLQWYKGSHGFSAIDKNLTVYSPLLLPFPYSKLSLFINKLIFNKSISRWTSAAKFNNPVVISFLPTPLIQNAIKNIVPKLSVYYCANNMAESSISASQVSSYEDKFFSDVDIVFTAACVIQDYASKFSEKVFYFPPGIDFDKFDIAIKSSVNIPDDLNDISGPIVGYIGTLGRVLDQNIICAIADQCSNFTIVLIGPKYTNIKELEKRKNIVLLGARPHDQLPYYIKRFDVGIVPYVCNEFTEGVYPSKLNEYLAMGIPSVSTNLREVRESTNNFAKVAIITDSVQEFVDAVRESVVENSVSFKELRIKAAEANSWESRFKGMSKILEENIRFKEKSMSKVNWQNRFNAFFKANKFYKRTLSFVLLSYLIIFHTPLFWFMGDQLIVKDALKKTDAIVVFSGDGEVDYQNLSYQKRALDAIKFYDSGYADKIILSSGREQTIADVEIIKLYLTNKGVPESSIYILDKYPDSTYKNVVMVNQILDKNDIDSILFLTAPYHSLRSVLLWKSYAPNIDLVVPKMIGSQSEDVKWSMKLDNIKVILYEYMAIIYNWLKGRI